MLPTRVQRDEHVKRELRDALSLVAEALDVCLLSGPSASGLALPASRSRRALAHRSKATTPRPRVLDPAELVEEASMVEVEVAVDQDVAEALTQHA